MTREERDSRAPVGARAYWLTGLDALRPLRRVTRRRLLHLPRQRYGTVAQAILHALLQPGGVAPP
jgi:hypothetical protein